MSAVKTSIKSNIKKDSQIQSFFQQLWQSHLKITPSTKKIIYLLANKDASHNLDEKKINKINDKLKNKIKVDHISFRNVGYKETGLSKFTRAFSQHGYEVKNTYDLSHKNMDALHLAPKNENSKLPKIFISQLNIDTAPDWVQESLLSCIGSCANKDSHDFLQWGAPWDKSYIHYQKLADYSEYAGWFYNHGMVANHFALDINSINNCEDIYEVANYLQNHNIKFNTDGGIVKGEGSNKLLQSSTIADLVDVSFNNPEDLNGKIDIKVPGGFNEFSQRENISSLKSIKSSSLTPFEGFISSSAEKLFTSTDRCNSLA